MSWFSAITGFSEVGYRATRERLRLDENDCLVSEYSEKRHVVGTFNLPNLRDLRADTLGARGTGRIRVRNIVGDVRSLHSEPRFNGALFQVASQFNMLEMTGPEVTPEDGVTMYEYDLTQGPACAIAAGAATIYRNYLVPVGGQTGQTEDRQLNGVGDLGDRLSAMLGCRPTALWKMKNGYLLATRQGLGMISELLSRVTPEERESLKGDLRVGLQQGTHVTLGGSSEPNTVSQVFCSAVPVAYSDHSDELWEPLARLVLEAAYEATLRIGLRTLRAGGSNKVLLTRLGGGAFGNREQWIADAMYDALKRVITSELDVFVVSHGAAPETMLRLEQEFEWSNL